MQDQFHTFNMFDCQAWYARDVIMNNIQIPSDSEVEKDINDWFAKEEKLGDTTPAEDLLSMEGMERPLAMSSQVSVSLQWKILLNNLLMNY